MVKGGGMLYIKANEFELPQSVQSFTITVAVITTNQAMFRSIDLPSRKGRQTERPRPPSHHLVCPGIITLNLKHLRRQLLHIRILNPLQRPLNAFNRLWLQPSSVLGVHINPRRREERLSKHSNNPLITSPLFLPPAQELPMAARNHQQALAAPVPFASASTARTAAGYLIHAMHGGDFVAVEALVGD